MKKLLILLFGLLHIASPDTFAAGTDPFSGQIRVNIRYKTDDPFAPIGSDIDNNYVTPVLSGASFTQGITFKQRRRKATNLNPNDSTRFSVWWNASIIKMPHLRTLAGWTHVALSESGTYKVTYQMTEGTLGFSFGVLKTSSSWSGPGYLSATNGLRQYMYKKCYGNNCDLAAASDIPQGNMTLVVTVSWKQKFSKTIRNQWGRFETSYTWKEYTESITLKIPVTLNLRPSNSLAHPGGTGIPPTPITTTTYKMEEEEEAVSITTEQATGVEWYPNPVSDQLFIKPNRDFSGEPVSIEIFNLEGQLIQRRMLELKSEEVIALPVKEWLNSGIYLVNLITPDGVQQDKLIVK